MLPLGSRPSPPELPEPRAPARLHFPDGAAPCEHLFIHLVEEARNESSGAYHLAVGVCLELRPYRLLRLQAQLVSQFINPCHQRASCRSRARLLSSSII